MHVKMLNACAPLVLPVPSSRQVSKYPANTHNHVMHRCFMLRREAADPLGVLLGLEERFVKEICRSTSLNVLLGDVDHSMS